MIVEVVDDNPNGSLSSFYQVAIDVVKPVVEIPYEEPAVLELEEIVSSVQIEESAVEIVISDISETGEVTLEFNEDMDVENFFYYMDQVNSIGSSGIVAGTSSSSQPSTTSQPDTPTTGGSSYIGGSLPPEESESTVATPMKIYIVPGPDAEPIELQFDWEIADFSTRELKIQLLFDNPRYVSSLIDDEQLQIEILDTPLFMDASGLKVKSNTIVESAIVRQIDPLDDSVSAIKASSVGFGATSIALVVGVLIFFMIVTGSDDPFVWSFINTIQLLTHGQLLSVKMAGNVALFMNTLIGIFRFDFIKSTTFTRKTGHGLSPSPHPSFLQGGYKETHFIDNTLNMFVVALLVGLALAITEIIMRKGSPKAKARTMPIYKRLVWGIPTRLFLLFFL